MSIIVVTDSVASLPKKDIGAYGLKVLSMHISAGGQEFVDTRLDVDEFYRRYLTDPKNIPTSSQPSIDETKSMFEQIARAGDDMVAVLVGEKFSGTYSQACLVAEMVKKDYPGWGYRIVDSASNSMQEGYIALSAAKCAAEGGSLDQCVDAAKKTMPRSKFIFSPAALTYLRAGGRIGGASALLANMLQIRPVLTIKNSDVAILAKVRTAKRAVAYMEKVFSDDVERAGLVDLVVHYIGDNKDLATQWAKEFFEPIARRVVSVLPVSPVTGVHVGTALGVAYQTVEPVQ